MKAVAVLWDQSFLWGLFVYDALNSGNIPFDVISSSDVRKGKLRKYRLLIVPGGWASQKIELLGDAGALEIRSFIHQGGQYIGFCGGAGMALSGKNTLNIVPVKRLPLKERLPSASGEVTIKWTVTKEGLFESSETLNTSIWWPAQFKPGKIPSVEILAVYEKVGNNLWVADIPFSDASDVDISEFEALYGINLDPHKYLLGRPAIIEANFGKGHLFLSYPHLETPDNHDSRCFLTKLVEKYSSDLSIKLSSRQEEYIPAFVAIHPRHTKRIGKMVDRVNELIDYGITHFLWHWRMPWLLGWRRGVRGLEYSMLSTSLAFLHRSFQALEVDTAANQTNELDEELSNLESLVDDFCHKSFDLLRCERFFLAKKVLPKLGKVNSRIDPLRKYLFGTGMNHGGLCKIVFDKLDKLLLFTIKQLSYCNLKIFFTNNKNDFRIEGVSNNTEIHRKPHDKKYSYHLFCPSSGIHILALIKRGTPFGVKASRREWKKAGNISTHDLKTMSTEKTFTDISL